ncbi:hypothetical protein BH23PLA1_BH23PLA1_28010 [soil metagenome]
MPHVPLVLFTGFRIREREMIEGKAEAEDRE